MGNGSGAAALRTSSCSATTSTSPVGSSGLALPSGRSPTSPVTWMQNSLRSWCATASSRTTTWTTPLASRRSMKVTPPWSRRRATQPASVTVWPACSARSEPASWVRITCLSPRDVQVCGVGGDLLAAPDVLDLVCCRPGTRRRGCRGARRTGSACRTSARSRPPRWRCRGGAARVATVLAGGARLLVDQGDQHRARAPWGRARGRRRRTAGSSVRETPKLMPTPGYVVRPSLASASYRPPPPTDFSRS